MMTTTTTMSEVDLEMCRCGLSMRGDSSDEGNCKSVTSVVSKHDHEQSEEDQNLPPLVKVLPDEEEGNQVDAEEDGKPEEETGSSTKSSNLSEEKEPTSGRRLSRLEEEEEVARIRMYANPQRNWDDEGETPPSPMMMKRFLYPDYPEVRQGMGQGQGHGHGQGPRYLNKAYWEDNTSSGSGPPKSGHPPSGGFFHLHQPQNYQTLRQQRQQQRLARKPKPRNVADRVASDERLTVMDLKSQITMLQDEVDKLKKENKFLNHLHHRQESALKKWEGKDADLPKLLNQQKDEIRSLQQQLRRSQQQTRELNEKVNMRDKKSFRLEAELEKLRNLVNDEHLKERDELQQELDITRGNLAGAEKRIREYMKHVDTLEKNHRVQLASQEKKLLKEVNGVYELEQLVANLRIALKNKDKMLNHMQMRTSAKMGMISDGVELNAADLYAAMY